MNKYKVKKFEEDLYQVYNSETNEIVEFIGACSGMSAHKHALKIAKEWNND